VDIHTQARYSLYCPICEATLEADTKVEAKAVANAHVCWEQAEPTFDSDWIEGTYVVDINLSHHTMFTLTVGGFKSNEVEPIKFE